MIYCRFVNPYRFNKFYFTLIYVYETFLQNYCKLPDFGQTLFFQETHHLPTHLPPKLGSLDPSIIFIHFEIKIQLNFNPILPGGHTGL